MPIARAALKLPALPEETVDVPELGGELLVRGLLLSQRLGLFSRFGKDDAGDAGVFVHIPSLLHLCVLADDHKPAFTVEQWEQIGGAHQSVALRLYQVAQRLSGLDIEAEKKT